MIKIYIKKRMQDCCKVERKEKIPTKGREEREGIKYEA